MSQYLSINTFGGLDRTNQLIVPINSPAGNILKLCENFRGAPDLASVQISDPLVGMIMKSPEVSSYKTTMPAAGRARGLFQFFPTVGTTVGSYLLAFQCTTSYTAGTMYALDIDNNVWKTLGTNFDPYHADFAQYGNKAYITLSTVTGASGGIYKWWHGDTAWEAALPLIKDKGGTAVNITGATLTWNATATVTSDINISALILKGDWIRRSSTSVYWDEVKSVAAGGLTITLIVASSDNGASAAGGAQKAEGFDSSIGEVPKFIKIFKDKMWCTYMINDTTNCGSRLRWSVTGDMEDWTSSGSGYMDIDHSSGEITTGLTSLDDYLFVFKDFSYYVYRWTGDLDEPIELVKVFNYGCIAQSTICEISDGLIYLSQGALRITNGNSDVDISGSMKEHFSVQLGWQSSSYYFSLNSYDNARPWTLIDKFHHFYSLFLTSGTANAYDFNYDYLKNQWAGTDYYYNAGRGCTVYSTTTKPVPVISKMSSSNQLIQFSPYAGNVTTSGYLESASFTSGIASKKLKIYWVEFEFHPILSAGIIDTTINFNYRKDFKAIDSAKQQTYHLDYAIGDGLDRSYISDTHRFQVNDECRYFSWYLTESFGGAATDDIGIISWTISYDLLDTV